MSKDTPSCLIQENGHIPPSEENLGWREVASCVDCSAVGLRTSDKMCPACGGVFHPINNRQWIGPVTVDNIRWSWIRLGHVKTTKVLKEGYWDAGEYW